MRQRIGGVEVGDVANVRQPMAPTPPSLTAAAADERSTAMLRRRGDADQRRSSTSGNVDVALATCATKSRFFTLFTTYIFTQYSQKVTVKLHTSRLVR